MKDKCDKDCKSCEISQRTYCATQMAIRNQDMIAEILTIIKVMNNKKEENLISLDNKVQEESEVANDNGN